jgi:hypothetical protein
MAGASLLTLLDDIAAVLDDVALMSKMAAKKTAGVLGDDLALNAQQVSGVASEREIPVVWAVAQGSFKNKLILVPSALLISAFIPWLIMPLLLIGGLFSSALKVQKRSWKNSSLIHTNMKKKKSKLILVNRLKSTRREKWLVRFVLTLSSLLKSS